jgi:hypothetical protein
VRGRVMSLLLLTVVGPLPVVFAAASAASELFGPRAVLALAAVFAVASGTLGLTRRALARSRSPAGRGMTAGGI